jgi:prevent-host-death family protein
MQTVNIHYAKTHLSRLLAKVAIGEEVIIAKSGKPMAKLSRVHSSKKRVGGFAKGQIKMSKDFNDEELIRVD